MIRPTHFLDLPWHIHWHEEAAGPHHHLWWLIVALVLAVMLIIGVSVTSGLI